MIQRIGILTAGGDCPGLNAVIRAVAKTAIYQHRIRVFGIEDGFQGLAEGRIGELSSLHVSGILTRGGTILGTNNRYNPTRVWSGRDASGNPVFMNRIDDCLRNIESNRLDALIVIGGDGSMACAAPLADAGVRVIGVPKTIDNDIVGTDITFGFMSAVATATDALDRLHSTAASHHRVMVCELMGRNAGWLTLSAGVASGSDVILLPEIPFDLDAVCAFVQSRMHRGRGFSIVACAEGARPVGGEAIVRKVDPTSPDPIRLGGVGKWVADRIEERSGLETRFTVLGHIQRGGSPIAPDRVLATQFGFRAMQVLMEQASAAAAPVAGPGNPRGRMVVMQNGELGDIDLRVAASGQRLVPRDHELIAAARAVRTCMGD